MLRVAEVPDPGPPGPGQALVAVRASSVHADAWHTVTGLPYVMRVMGNGLRPRGGVPGSDVAGEVVAVGEGVDHLSPGDRVWGETVEGIPWRDGGAWAERVLAPADALARIPPGVDDEQAVAVGTPGVLALEVLRDQGRLRPGASVCVNGAAGAMGQQLVQLAKALGARRVVGVDRGDTAATLRALGCDDTVDHLTEDVTRGGERFDVVVDVASSRPYRDWRPALAPHATYVRVGHDHYGAGMNRWLGSMGEVLSLMARAPFDEHLHGVDRSAPRPQRLAELSAMLADGVLRPVVAATFPLERTVDALRLLESGTVAGRILLVPGR